jgi:acyl-CoA thioester hydrolase
VRLALTPSTDPDDYPFTHRVRTRFAETDAMGIVHHAAYLPYLEEARVALLRHLGHPYTELRSEGVDLVVLEAFVRYRRPLHFDDVVELGLAVGAVTRTSFQLAYLLRVEDEVRATAVTVHGAIDADGRPRRLPDWCTGPQFTRP